MKAVSKSRYLLFFALASGGCAVDLASKHLVFQSLGMPGPNAFVWIWDGYFALQTSLNEGALFGMGQGKVALIATLSVMALLVILYWLFVAGAARCSGTSSRS